MEVAHLIATHILRQELVTWQRFGCKGCKKCSRSGVSVEKMRWLVKTYQYVCDSICTDKPLYNSLEYVAH